MNKGEAEKRIERLREMIRHHRYLYHVENRSEISPEVLDSLKKELFDLENEYPDLVTNDSPTQRVAGKPLDGFEKVEHRFPMYSIDDAFSKEDMSGWRDRNNRLVSRLYHYFCEIKFDGVALELVYEGGVLVSASTRGDGLVGEDVTYNIRTVEAIPLSVEKDVVVRGELLIPKDEFERINNKREKRGLEPYANPRNLAAGSVRQLDPKVVKGRGLDFFAFGLVNGQESHEQDLKLLRGLGFKISPMTKRCKDLNCVWNFFEEVLGKRNDLSYEIDGVVVNIDENDIFEKLGVTGKSPRGIIALKFPLKKATTVVLGIEVQVGRTGVLTPVAILKPVQVGGVRVSRATLHNQDEIERLDIRVGDTVVVGRAGDVIPRIIKVLKEMRSGREEVFKMPKNCPVCGSLVTKKSSEVDYYCSNEDCFARQRRQLAHFVSRAGFNIEGLGTKILDKLLENNLIGDMADLFTLQKGDLLPLEGFQDKAAENITEEIGNSKKITLSRFLYALGIRNVGQETAFVLAQRFKSLDKIEHASQTELESVKDIGEVVASCIKNWFDDPKNKELVGKLREHVKIELEGVGSKLKGKIFVITGSLKSMTRSEAEDKIRGLGGSSSGSVSSQTDYVVVGDSSGSKHDKALKLGVEILSEDKFLELINV